MTGLRALVARLTEARANRTKGCKCFDEYVCPRCTIVATAEADLADAITPDVLAAVEAVRRLGHWRNVLAVIDPNSPLATVSIVQARTERDRAYESLEQLADRLAARKGE